MARPEQQRHQRKLHLERLDPFIDNHFATLPSNNYPEPGAPPLPGQLRAGEHTDFGSLTILAMNDAPGGLQVQMSDGAWRDVKAARGQFIVNIGDMMARWTADHWASTLHRVVNPPADRRVGSRRRSLVFFHNPAAGTVIEVLEPFRRSGE